MNYSKQRDLILNIVKSTDVHPTAEWVYQEARKVMPKIGIATVYRNLNALTEMGAIRKVTGPDNLDRFDGFTENHYHMACVCCGRLMDLKPVDEGALAKLTALAQETFGEADETMTLSTVLLNGFCEECRREKEKKH